jgi:hypothetical protein
MDENTIEALYYQHPYVVYLADDLDVEYAGGRYVVGYKVLNTDTGVIEFASPSYPDCLSVATQGASAIRFFDKKLQEGDDFDEAPPEEILH